MSREKTAGKQFRRWIAAGMLVAALLLCGFEPEESDCPVITVAFFMNEEQAQDLPLVEEKINQLTTEKIQVGIHILPISDSDSLSDKYLMKIKEGEVDLVNVSSFLNWAKEGMLLPLDQLLEEYGSGILGLLDEEVLASGRLEQVQYGVPRFHEWAQSYGVCMRTDLLDKYQISGEEIHSVEDFEKALEIICSNEPEIAGVAPMFMVRMDTLFDEVGVLMEPEKSGAVSDYYKSQQFITEVKRIRAWAQKGYLSTAGYYYEPRTKMQLQEMMRAGRIFSYIARYKPGLDVQESNVTGQELTAVRLTEPLLGSDQLNYSLVGINAGCQEPEAAMKLLNLLYTDPELANLICWGIEGVHYVKNEDGTIACPEGRTAADIGYNFNRNWQHPNQYLAYVWQGDSVDLGEEVKRYNEEAPKSVALGIYFDESSYKLERDRVKEVAEAYLEGFLKGEFDPEVMLPAFWRALDEAGIQKVIAEKQRQMDAYLQEKRDGGRGVYHR